MKEVTEKGTRTTVVAEKDSIKNFTSEILQLSSPTLTLYPHAWVDTSGYPSVFISHYNGHGIILLKEPIIRP